MVKRKIPNTQTPDSTKNGFWPLIINHADVVLSKENDKMLPEYLKLCHLFLPEKEQLDEMLGWKVQIQ